MLGVQGRAVVSITLRAAMGRRRALLFALPPLLLILLTVMLKAASPGGPGWPADVLGSFGLPVVVPLTALIIGTSVLGAEIDDGSIIHLLATPVPRWVVIAGKYAVATAGTMAFAAVAELLAGLIAAGPARLAFGMFVGALAGSVIYNALFVMLSVLTTRAIAVGLGYVLLWEGLLAHLAGGARLLSAGQYSLTIAYAITHDHRLRASLSLGTAVVLGVLVTVAALGLAVRRLASFSLTGEAV